MSDGLSWFNATADAGVQSSDRYGWRQGQLSAPGVPGRERHAQRPQDRNERLLPRVQVRQVAKYAHRYLGEFQFRFNRREEMRHMLQETLRAMLASSPASAESLRMPETSC